MDDEPLTLEAFEALVAEAFTKLPEWIRDETENVALLVEEIPNRETVEELGLDSDTVLLGLYRGVPKTKRDNNATYELPDTVTLYKLAIEAESYAKGKPLEDVIFETLWHELGHHFGHDEEGIRKREEEEFGED